MFSGKTSKPGAAQTVALAGKQPLFLNLSIKDQILFAKRLALLIRAGVPILMAIKMLKKQANNKHATYIMENLHMQVEQGVFLSAGMAHFKKIFGEFAVNVVRVGELSGTLQDNLSYLAEELKKKQELRRKIVSALVYPIFIVFATLGVVILLTAYVFPKIMPIFQSFQFQLPWTTRTLIFLSNLFLHYGWLIGLGVAALFAAFVFSLQIHSVRLKFDTYVLKLPLLGPMFKSYYIANFTRTLGLLIKSDMRLVEALHIVASTTGNTAYKKEFYGLIESVTRGERISAHMEQNTKLFPSILTQMIEVGESTGTLSNTLMYLADMYEDDLNNATKNLSTSIEPVLMIFMGLLVGFIALSIITPIYGITQNIHP